MRRKKPHGPRKGKRVVSEFRSRRIQAKAGKITAIVAIRSMADQGVGALLTSPDGQATLVIIELANEFPDPANIAHRQEGPAAARHDPALGQLPKGLEIAVTGSAVVGADRSRLEEESAAAIERWTVWVIVGLLILVYRAPVVALIPLITVFVAVEVATKTLVLLASAGMVTLFRGLDVYTTVIVYGAGVDYCLFLISRYREELGESVDVKSALSRTIRSVGTAVAASAGTVIVGVAMLLFADFDKFHQAGITIPFGLFTLLIASLTLTTSLLALFGRWAFWPNRPETSHDVGAGWMHGFWEKVAHLVRRRPGLVWLLALGLMLPPAGLGLWKHNDLNFGLIAGLPDDALSVRGIDALRRHFPPGVLGTATITLTNESSDFSSEEGRSSIATLTERLARRKDGIGVADLRSLSDPLGVSPAGRKAMESLSGGLISGSIVRQRAQDRYVSGVGKLAGHVTRIEVVPTFDPFSRQAMNRLGAIESAVRESLPETLRRGTTLHTTGATASLRDLRDVARGDRVRIYTLVTVGVLLILVALLRRVAVPIYLILTVLLGYLATVGVTYAVYWLHSGGAFPGLHWTVPTFLFTLLIAVGEDYNIFLVTRIDEEQGRQGPVRGIERALIRTGGIISACGVVMAGTFSTLALGGSLARMYQLGFALAFGVLLDTFLVRPVLVPAYLMLLQGGHLGRLGKVLGGQAESSPENPEKSGRAEESEGEVAGSHADVAP